MIVLDVLEVRLCVYLVSIANETYQAMAIAFIAVSSLCIPSTSWIDCYPNSPRLCLCREDIGIT